jgi:hypothetical protein
VRIQPPDRKSVVLLALSPVFFAQTTLVHLDLAAALFTTLAVLFLLEDALWLFALAASLAVISKETAVVLLPVAWLYVWRRQRSTVKPRPWPLSGWMALAAPLAPLAAWTLYYHHVTGFWTGNSEYLSYNLYSTLSPERVFLTLWRRVYELFFGGFNWLLTVSVPAGFWWGRKHAPLDPARVREMPSWRQFIFLTAGLIAIYLLLLSVAGGAILPRYLLPVLPLFYLAAVAIVMRLPRLPARLICAGAAACFVCGWFMNPPYPFPYEDNLAYADFIRLHQQAAQYLEGRQGLAPSGPWQGQPRILTAWPATDEISRPFLGYVREPLDAVATQGFTPQELAGARPESFDLLYLYSRKWEPPGNWVARFPGWLRVQGRYFDYRPQISAEDLAMRYHLKLLARFERRGQWVEIYSH